MEKTDTDRIVAAILTVGICDGKGGLDQHLSMFDTVVAKLKDRGAAQTAAQRSGVAPTPRRG
jgi:hypothetical protein